MSELAARLREAFLGTETGEAVPFDELKDAVKDRWQRVADAARVPAEVPPLSTIQRMSENQGYSTAPPAMPTPLPATIEVLNFDPPTDQVEALARVLCRWDAHDAPHEDSWATTLLLDQNAYRHMARAAIAHLSTQPEGLPTMRDLREIGVHAYLSHDSAKRENAGCMVDPMGAATDAILAALRPWLRDPVGGEMDVTWQEVQEWLEPDSIGRRSSPHEILDLFRSRIRRVYECKECAKKDDEYQDLISATNDEADRINRAMDAINAARAALEGE